jgi:hypothetical protein
MPNARHENPPKVIVTLMTSADMDVSSSEEKSPDIRIENDADKTTFLISPKRRESCRYDHFFDVRREEGIIQSEDVEKRVESLESKVGPIENALTRLWGPSRSVSMATR